MSKFELVALHAALGMTRCLLLEVLESHAELLLPAATAVCHLVPRLSSALCLRHKCTYLTCVAC